jgi:hypothetical protein
VVKGFRPSPILADSLTGPGPRHRDGEFGVPVPRQTGGPVG